MNYSKALMVVRATKGLQQKDVAEILGITPSYVSRIEKGERPMSPKMIKELCEKLEIPENLFCFMGHESSNLDPQDSKLIDEMGTKLLKIIMQG